MKRFFRLGLLACCAALLLTAGWCERYQQKNDRRENMRRHYDSLLRQEHLRKDSIWRANRNEWEREHNGDEWKREHNGDEWKREHNGAQ